MDAEPRWLNDAEQRAWMGYRRMRLLLDAQVARDLQEDSGLSAPDYDVLSTLSETEGHRWRLTKLADRMLWSKSRLSRHIARMEQRGLVTREECATDGRCAIVVLTDEGLRAIEKAAPDHVESVRRHFIDLLSVEQLDTLAAIADTVLTHLAERKAEDQPIRPAPRAMNKLGADLTQPDVSPGQGSTRKRAGRLSRGMGNDASGSGSAR
jgi:DNA-binding MarR family transcriptional regulator